MPIYEYRRPDGSTFEIIQSFSEDPLIRDPETGVKVQRVLHAPAVHFKGKGFYNTDYGTRKRQRETAASASEGSSSDSASSGSGDSSSSDSSSSAGGDTSSSSNGKSNSSEGKSTAGKDTSKSKSKPVGAKS